MKNFKNILIGWLIVLALAVMVVMAHNIYQDKAIAELYRTIEFNNDNISYLNMQITELLAGQTEIVTGDNGSYGTILSIFHRLDNLESK